MSAPRPFKQSVAVVIGIDSYRAPLSELRTAANDARELGRILREEHAYDHVIEVLDGVATRERVSDLLSRELPTLVGPEDRVLFYFAGHGVARDGQDGPNGYLMPADANPRDIATQLHMPWVHDALTALPCRHMLIVLDACFSGAFRWSATRSGGADVDDEVTIERYERFVNDPAWQVITSASSSETANDSLANAEVGTRFAEGKHSPFAEALFGALRGDADVIPAGKGDGLVTVSELFAFVMDKVLDRSQSESKRQTPSYWPLQKHGRGEYLFFVPGKTPALEPAPPLSFADNPWRGLASYNAADRTQYFGREDAIQDVLALVLAEPFTVVLGASGTGKSSLLKAGVLPRLEDERWHVLPIVRPDVSPFASMGRALSPSASVTATLPAMGASLTTAAHVTVSHAVSASAKETQLSERATRIREFVASALLEHPQRGVVLLLDQFEELITLVRDKEERDAFLALLASLVKEHRDRLRVIVTLRSDFKSNFDDAELFGETWRAGQYVVPLMSRDDLRATIERPASARVLYFEPPELVDTLVDEVIATPGALPLLSFALSEMYIGYVTRQNADQQLGKRTDRSITQADFDALGGVVGALRVRADAEYDAMSPEERATAERVLLRMVSAEGGNLARRGVTEQELVFPTPEETARVKAVVDRLTAARLLVGGERNGERFVEPAHDALVRGWVKLIEWVRAAADAPVPLVTRQKLAAAAADWDAAEKVAKAGLLWSDPVRGAMLRPEVNREAPWMNDRELRFAKRSVRGGTIARWVRIGTTAVIAVAAVVAVWQKNEATKQARAANDQLSATYLEAAADTSASWDIRMANAAAATQFASDPEVAGSGLLMLLASRPPVLSTLEVGSRVEQATFGRRGELVATLSGLTVQVWDATTGDRLGNRITLSGGGRSSKVRFSPDGERLLTVAADRGIGEVQARVWNARTGAPIGVPIVEPAASGATFSADGRAVITWSAGDTVRVWDAMSGVQRGASQRVPNRVIGYSADATRLLLSVPNESKAIVWYLLTGERITIPYRDVPYGGARFSPDGDVVATWTNGLLKLWSASDGTPLSPVISHGDSSIAAVWLSEHGDTLRSVTRGGIGRTWRTRDGSLLSSSVAADSSDVGSEHFSSYRDPEGLDDLQDAGFSVDGARVWLRYSDSWMREWETHGWTPVGPPRRIPDLRVDQGAVAFTPHGVRLLASSTEKSVEVLAKNAGVDAGTYLSHSDTVLDVRFSADGARLVTASADGSARVWDGYSGAAIGPFLRHPASLHSAMFNATGTRIITQLGDTAAYIWDAKTFTKIGMPIEHETYIVAVSSSLDGARALTASYDGLVRVNDTRTGMQIGTTINKASQLWHARLSADGRRVITVDSSRFDVWDVMTGKRSSASFALAPSESFDFLSSVTSRGSFLVTVVPGLNRTSRYSLRDALSGAAIGTPFDADSGSILALNENGSRMIVTVGEGGGIIGRADSARIWNTQSGVPVGQAIRHRGYEDYLTAAEFSSNGTRVLTISSDGTARIWDARTGLPVGVPLLHQNTIRAAHFSPDGQRAVTASVDATGHLWDTRTVREADRSALLDLAELMIGGQMRGPRDFWPVVTDRNRRIQESRKRAAAWTTAPNGSFEQWVHWYFAGTDVRPDQLGVRHFIAETQRH